MSAATATREVGFRGEIRGVVYTDKADFVAAAKGLGWTGYAGNGGEHWSWRVGAPVKVRLRDDSGRRAVSGTVWSKSSEKSLVWVALETGKFVAVNIHSGSVYETLSTRGGRVGEAERVAA